MLYWKKGIIRKMTIISLNSATHRRLLSGTLASLHTRSRLHRLTSNLTSPGVFRNGVTCSVLSGLRARLSLLRLWAPRNISGCRVVMMFSERSSSRRDERFSRRPSGKLFSRFLARFSRVSAGISSNVPGWRTFRPQFAHSKRNTLSSNEYYCMKEWFGWSFRLEQRDLYLPKRIVLQARSFEYWQSL